MTDPCEPLLTMKELSEATGISQRLIHLHERRGFITSVRKQKGGNRTFHPEAITRLQKVKQLQAIGLTFDEISEVLPLYMHSDDQGLAGKRRAIEILRTHLAETDTRLTELTQLRESIIASIARLELLADLLEHDLNEGRSGI